MKSFKRLLALALAIVLSLSLFACAGDPELKLNPIEGEIEQEVDADQIVDVLYDRMTPVYTYKEGDYSDKHVKAVKEKFIELTGLDKIAKNAEGCALNVKITETKDFGTYIRYHILFNSEYGVTVPCYLLVPNAKKDSYPLAITLHGHSNYGYHYAVGNLELIESRLPNPDTLSSEEEIAALNATLKEIRDYAATADFAVQAVERGYAALAIEQRGMSDRTATSKPEGASMCEKAAQNELVFGRTLVGARVWDISKAIDALSDSVLKDITSKIDLKDITITGNSGGGTASFYAGCYDERITVVAPSCGFCSFKESILDKYHCSCNIIPGIYEWFDMQDLACLIAPRKLAIIAGIDDTVFPSLPNAGAEHAYDTTVTQIYKDAGAEGNCIFKMTNYGHTWVENDVWKAISDVSGKK